MRAAFVAGMIALADAIRAASGLESAELLTNTAVCWLVLFLVFFVLDLVDLCAKILKRSE